MRLLVFNAGSSSLKFDLLDASGGATPVRIAGGSFADMADGSSRYEMRPKPAGSPPLRVGTLAEAAEAALAWLSDATVHGGNLLAGVEATVHRIVHGGERFRATTVLNEPEVEALRDLSALAPLHNPPALSVIAAVGKWHGLSIPVIGVFDTAFYAELPERAYLYAVPPRWRTEYGIRRYGFHGLAHRYLNLRAGKRLSERRNAPPDAARIVSLQLGRGCSVTASLGGRAIATSMGFTPLEGLVMGTRSGDIDAGAVLFVMQRSGMSAADVSRELNEKSGLLGLSGQSADMRELLERERRGDAAAAVAVDIFCRRARHYLGAYIAELGGVDAIAFGGGIGENSPDIRRRIASGFAWAGIELDVDLNRAGVGVESDLDSPGSRTAIFTIPVDEASIIAGEAAALLSTRR